MWSESLALLGASFFLGGPAFLLPGGDPRAGFLAELPGGFGWALLALGFGLGEEGFGWAAAAFGGRGVVPSAEQGAGFPEVCDFPVDEGEDVGVLRHRGPEYGMGRAERGTSSGSPKTPASCADLGDVCRLA